MSLRWPLALAGSAAAHALGWQTVVALWKPAPVEADETVAAVELLEEGAPDATVPSKTATEMEPDPEAGVAAAAATKPPEDAPAAPPVPNGAIANAAQAPVAKPEQVDDRTAPAHSKPPAARLSIADATRPPPPAPEQLPEAEKPKPPPKEPDDSAKNIAAAGPGAVQSFKFARTATPDQGESAPATPYIGDRNVSTPATSRVATTTERSSGNARGGGEALPVPEAHQHDERGELARIAVAEPSPEAQGGNSTSAGSAHIFQVDEAPRRKRVAEPEAALAPPQPPPPPAEEPAADGFWGGHGPAVDGEGDASTDSPEPTAGENVQRAVFKKDGAGWTEVTALDDSVQLGDQAAVSIRQTDMGVWFTPVDDLVRLGWRPPLDQIALGVTGRVTLQFVVKRNGRVTELAMVDANVPLSLQEAALLAVPSAVAPPPRGSAPLRVRYVFRYGTTGTEVN